MAKKGEDMVYPWSVKLPAAFYTALKNVAHWRSKPKNMVFMKDIIVEAALSGDTELREEYYKEVKRLQDQTPKDE